MSAWPWILVTGLFGMGWLGTALLWWRDRRGRQHAPLLAGVRAGDSATWHRIAHACRQNDASAAYAAVLTWLHSLPSDEADDLRRSLDDPDCRHEASRRWRALGRDLHGPQQERVAAWDGAAFLQALRELRRERDARKTAASPALPPLYPAENQPA